MCILPADVYVSNNENLKYFGWVNQIYANGRHCWSYLFEEKKREETIGPACHPRGRRFREMA